MKELLTKIPTVLSCLKKFWDKLGEGHRYLKSYISRIGTSVNINEREQAKEYALTTLVEKARKEWEEAQALFNEVKEPDLIDHAIFAMEATERKYMFLLSEAKKERVINEDINQFLN